MNKPEFDLEKFEAGKQVVNCRTEKDAIAFCSWLYFILNIEWANGYSYMDGTGWDICEEDTCYESDGDCESISYYTCIGRQIVRYTPDIIELRPLQEE